MVNVFHFEILASMGSNTLKIIISNALKFKAFEIILNLKFKSMENGCHNNK